MAARLTAVIANANPITEDDLVLAKPPHRRILLRSWLNNNLRDRIKLDDIDHRWLELYNYLVFR